MGFISNIKIKNVFESLTAVRKSKIVQKASSSRLVKVIPIALKKTFRKHVRDANVEEHAIEADHIESDFIASLIDMESPMEFDNGLSRAQSLPEELLQHSGFHREAITNATDTAADDIVDSNNPIDDQYSESKIDTDRLQTLPEEPFHQDRSEQEAVVNIANIAEDDKVNSNNFIGLELSKSNIAIGSVGSLPEESLHQDESDRKAIMTVTNTAKNDDVNGRNSIGVHSQGVTSFATNELDPMPEAERFRSTTQPMVGPSNTQEIEDLGFSTDASLNDRNEEAFVPMSSGNWDDNENRRQPQANGTNTTEDSFRLPQNFMNLIDWNSYLHMDFEKELLVAKCIDPSPNADEWIPVAEGLHGQNYATRYLPTIIHENKKTLSKFVRAFRDDHANKEIFNSLESAETAFKSLEKHFKKAGLTNCVVEFLKPANHPKRILEELQRARREYQVLWRKYSTSQDELNALTEKGAATDVQGDPRAFITVSELAALESDRDKWQQQFQTASTTLQERMDSLERETKSFEAMKESLIARTDAVSRLYKRMWRRQEEQHELFTKHHQEGNRVAQDITNKMYQDLADEHKRLQSLFCNFPIHLAESVHREYDLKRQLEAERKISRTSEVEELKKEIEQLKSEREKAEFLKTMQEFKHEEEVAELNKRLQEVEWRRMLTPEQLEEQALDDAFYVADESRRLFADSCFEIMRLRNELSLARECGLEIGTIVDQAEKVNEMRFPKTVWSPPPEWNSFFPESSGGAERAAESKVDENSHVEWTDDSEIF